MRSTRSHTGNRRSHHALKAPNLAVCKNCGAFYRPHHMCLACGFYKGRIVIDMKARQEARDARIQAKQAMRRAQAAEEQAENQAPAGVETSAETTDTSQTPEQK